MTDKKVLAFGFNSLLEIMAVSGAVKSVGAEVVNVAKTDYNKSLSALVGKNISMAKPYLGGPLGGRMLVFCYMNEDIETVLPALKKAGIGTDCLKAALTPYNWNWSAIELYAELRKEHSAMWGKQG